MVVISCQCLRCCTKPCCEGGLRNVATGSTVGDGGKEEDGGASSSGETLMSVAIYTTENSDDASIAQSTIS